MPKFEFEEVKPEIIGSSSPLTVTRKTVKSSFSFQELKPIEILRRALRKVVPARTFIVEGKESLAMRPPLRLMMEAIAFNETSIVKGNPYISKEFSGDNRLGMALGKYRVTEETLFRQSPKYLGRRVSTQEFLDSPQLQEEFMANRIGILRNKGISDQEIVAGHRLGFNAPLKESQQYVEAVFRFINERWQAPKIPSAS